MHSHTFTRNFSLLFCIVLLTACGTFPQNPPLAKYDRNAGYRFDQLDSKDNSDDLFVILAFSGGGMRAAALSYGVLEALRDTHIEWNNRKTSLLDEVDVILSVSGGSFTAAYYGLRGKSIFDEFPDKFLYRPIQSDLIKFALRPDSLLKITGPSVSRSDLAAEFYDREIFGGATYAQLAARRQRPFIILNATDMTLGAGFPFTQDQFDLLCSDLNGVPLARAVAASSAFPAGLTPLTFKNYAGNCNYQAPEWVHRAIDKSQARQSSKGTASAKQLLSYINQSPQHNYIHLTDGGISDNLALEQSLFASLTNMDGNDSWNLKRVSQGKTKKIVMIVVNAANHPDKDWDDSSHVPGLIETVSIAAKAAVRNHASATMENLRAIAEQPKRDRLSIDACIQLAAAKGPQCAPDVPMSPQADIFGIEVAFDYIESDEDQHWFKNIHTNLELPREAVDKLRLMARRLLSEEPQFQTLLKSLHGCLATNTQAC